MCIAEGIILIYFMLFNKCYGYNMKAIIPWKHNEKIRFTGKDKHSQKAEGSRKRERLNTKWIDSIKEAMAFSLTCRRQAFNDKDLLEPITHRVTMSRK